MPRAGGILTRPGRRSRRSKANLSGRLSSSGSPQRSLKTDKIPIVEQTLSAAAAAMNILNAAHALGFGAKWVTGPNCYDPEFRAAFGLDPADQLIAFIHIGTAGREIAVDRPDPSEFTTEWK